MNSLTLNDGIIVEQSTINSLKVDTNRAFPSTTKRQHVAFKVTIPKIEYVCNVPQKLLQIHSTTVNPSHSQTIQFDNVEFVEDGLTSIPLSNGAVQHFNPPSMSANVKVRCTCMDFHYRFAAYNNKDDSLVGDPPESYTKKTDSPEANAQHLPGMCKHLHKLVTLLQQKKIIQN